MLEHCASGVYGEYTCPHLPGLRSGGAFGSSCSLLLSVYWWCGRLFAARAARRAAVDRRAAGVHAPHFGPRVPPLIMVLVSDVGVWKAIWPAWRTRAHGGNFSVFMPLALDDDELLVRASAVLKSQGPENWSRGRPGPHWARTNPRSVRDVSCGKIREKTAGGVASCGATGPGY